MLVEKKVHPNNNSSRRDEMLVAGVRIKRHPVGNHQHVTLMGNGADELPPIKGRPGGTKCW